MFLAVVLILFKGLLTISAETCPSTKNAITVKDIQDAAHASIYIYTDTIVEGDIIPGTEFRINKTFLDHVAEGREGIRVGVADNDKNNARLIVYRGTTRLSQLLEQGSSVLEREQEWIIDGVTTSVLTYFYDAYQLAAMKLRRYLNDPKKKYILTGHSLGGALASMLAVDATQFSNGDVWRNPKSCLITFGQPRVGRSQYATVHDRLISTFRKLRFVNKGDPVTRLPSHIFGWRHHERPVYIGFERSFGRKRDMRKKDKRLLWQAKVFWQICGKAEDGRCVRSYTLPQLQFHQMRAYQELVNNPPQKIYTSTGTLETQFETALVESCESIS